MYLSLFAVENLFSYKYCFLFHSIRFIFSFISSINVNNHLGVYEARQLQNILMFPFSHDIFSFFVNFSHSDRFAFYFRSFHIFMVEFFLILCLEWSCFSWYIINNGIWMRKNIYDEKLPIKQMFVFRFLNETLFMRQ